MVRSPLTQPPAPTRSTHSEPNRAKTKGHRAITSIHSGPNVSQQAAASRAHATQGHCPCHILFQKSFPASLNPRKGHTCTSFSCTFMVSLMHARQLQATAHGRITTDAAAHHLASRPCCTPSNHPGTPSMSACQSKIVNSWNSKFHEQILRIHPLAE